MTAHNTSPSTSTFSVSQLPRLPIPELKNTLDRYLESVRPLVSKETFARTQAIASEFGRAGSSLDQPGPGEYLQNLLKEWDSKQPHSWLEKWWLDVAYHSWRDPLCVNSNYWLLFENDPNAYDIITESDVKQQSNSQKSVVDRVGYSDFQIRRAAKLTTLALDVMDEINRGDWPVEKTHDGPLSIEQYSWVFGVTRIPRPGCDAIKKSQTPARHIVAIIDDQLYYIRVYDKQGKRCLVGDIEDQLSAAVKHASSLTDKEKNAAICVLTGGHRDRWATVYADLLDSPQNGIVLDLIQEANFVVSLDDTITLPYGFIDAAQQTMKHHAARPGHNRWFDKMTNFIVDRNGVTGLCGEHSPCDALAIAVICNRITEDLAQHWRARYTAKDVPSQRSSSLTSDERQKPYPLNFVSINSNIKNKIQEAEQEIAKIALESVSVQLRFEEYGADWIKKIGPCFSRCLFPDGHTTNLLATPWDLSSYPYGDSRLSQILSWAHWRSSAHLSSESIAFVRAMDDLNKSPHEKSPIFANCDQNTFSNYQTILYW